MAKSKGGDGYIEKDGPDPDLADFLDDDGGGDTDDKPLRKRRLNLTDDDEPEDFARDEEEEDGGIDFGMIDDDQEEAEAEDSAEDDDDEDVEEEEAPPARKSAAKKAPARRAKQEEPTEEESEQSLEDQLPFLKKIKKDIIDPEIVEGITGLAKELVGIKKALGKKEEREQAERERQTLASFEEAVQRMGDAEILGEGAAGQLEPKSKAMRNRNRLLETMARTAAGYGAVGQKTPPFDQLFEEAYLAAFGRRVQKKEKERVTRELRDKVKKRAGQVMHVPGAKTAARTSKAETPRQRAMDHIRQFLK